MTKNGNVFVIEAEAEAGIKAVLVWVETTLGMRGKNNPDIVILRHGLFSVVDARRVAALAAGAPFVGSTKVLVLSADRAYHEAQNALLKLFEEPPEGVHLFFVLPSLGGLLPTLRSRVQVLNVGDSPVSVRSEAAVAFIRGTSAARKAIVKKLTGGKDESARAAAREEALALINGIEALVYEKVRVNLEGPTFNAHRELLGELATLRDYFHDRSAPTRLALEHLALVLPKDLV